MNRKGTVPQPIVKEVWAPITDEWGFVPDTPTEAEELRPIEGKPVHLGLCSSCKNDPDCTFPRDPSRPVLQCEEFEGEEMIRITTQRQRGSQGVEVVAEDAAQYKGLCRNCEEREVCTFPKPEGGVWRCEEYR
jgi:hypothetical protein